MVDVEEQARRGLASSGGLPIAVAYPVLTLCTGLAGDLWENHLGLLAGVIAGLMLLGAVREMAGQKLRETPSEKIEQWRFRYSLLVLAQALLWSVFSAGTVYVYGKSWTGLMACLVTAGITAGSTASLTPSFNLMRAYIPIIILPTAMALISHRNSSETIVGVTFLIYCLFMLSVGRRNHHRQSQLLSTLLDLQAARNESERQALQLRQLSAQQLQAVENERLHLAREVHDDLGQLLTALKINLARLEKVTDGAALDRVHETNGLVDHVMGAVRRIASSLRPPLLDELGLAAALDRFLSENCGRANLEYRLEIPRSLPPLTPAQSLAAFRVCQEAFTNVLRHARASHLLVALSWTDKEVCITVSDDGCGMEPEKMHSSLGLLGLQERLRLLGGQLNLHSQPDQGTLLEARFPLAG
ncbi:MAG: sensor histidine kinase [Candidatus Eremiobacteraeota bacterium]|nr:sensor histidine kinase [Candidatus Eremiobacteraeota bacterium]MCW5866979.1 sensor histidine kinase [Candidatus Eremiobacteraeota bacterium]